MSPQYMLEQTPPEGKPMTRAQFYGYYWYLMELEGRSVDEWSMERAWEDYQKDPESYESDEQFQAAKKRLDRAK